VFVDGLTGLFRSVAKGLPVTQPPTTTKGRRVLRSPEVSDVKREISLALDELRNSGVASRPVFIIDGLDFLLAATGEDVRGASLRTMLLEIQEVCELYWRRIYFTSIKV
jgi:hypothetical protein